LGGTQPDPPNHGAVGQPRPGPISERC
jgi:hypothetical protein